jgi:hypothetical protein
MRLEITRWLRAGTLVALCALVAAVPMSPLCADEPVKKEAEKPSVDAADVYLGNAANFRKPAEVDANAVYAEIPSYKKILEDDVEPGSARYELLMTKASRRFKSALRKVARAGGYDLVARLGSVKNAPDVPDITQDVIDHL